MLWPSKNVTPLEPDTGRSDGWTIFEVRNGPRNRPLLNKIYTSSNLRRTRHLMTCLFEVRNGVRNRALLNTIYTSSNLRRTRHLMTRLWPLLKSEMGHEIWVT